MILTALADAQNHIRFEDLHLHAELVKIPLFGHEFAIKWYSIAYISGILVGWWYLLKLIKQPGAPLARRHADGLVFYSSLGIIFGCRAGYVLFYKLGYYLQHPIDILKLSAGGMSFHAGGVGTPPGVLTKVCRGLVGRCRGGLGHVNVVANVIFAGMSGSAIADAVGIGRVIIGMMTRDGKYPVAYAAAITASAAIIGPIIPPSIPMVIYALVADTSIGFLFLGGVVPGLMLGVVFMVMNTLIARRRNYPVEPPVPLREIPRVALIALPALLLPIILLFGIYGGVTTPTEGAAAAAAYALLAAALVYRALSFRQLYSVLLSSAKATTSVGMLIAGALVFNYVVTIDNIPVSVPHFIGCFHLSSVQFLLLVHGLPLALG